MYKSQLQSHVLQLNTIQIQRSRCRLSSNLTPSIKLPFSFLLSISHKAKKTPLGIIYIVYLHLYNLHCGDAMQRKAMQGQAEEIMQSIYCRLDLVVARISFYLHQSLRIKSNRPGVLARISSILLRVLVM
jgi:hypothetical protein